MLSSMFGKVGRNSCRLNQDAGKGDFLEGLTIVLPKGYQSMVTQAWVGVVVDALAEFAPDIKRMLGKKDR
jgi:hypothetical protein